MVSFKEVNDSFAEKECKLLISEEEFNKTSHSTTEKYKYIASCGHEHSVWFNVFKSRNTGVVCPACKNKKIGDDKKEQINAGVLSKINGGGILLLYSNVSLNSDSDSQTIIGILPAKIAS